MTYDDHYAPAHLLLTDPMENAISSAIQFSFSAATPPVSEM